MPLESVAVWKDGKTASATDPGSGIILRSTGAENAFGLPNGKTVSVYDPRISHLRADACAVVGVDFSRRSSDVFQPFGSPSIISHCASCPALLDVLSSPEITPDTVCTMFLSISACVGPLAIRRFTSSSMIASIFLRSASGFAVTTIMNCPEISLCGLPTLTLVASCSSNTSRLVRRALRSPPSDAATLSSCSPSGLPSSGTFQIR